MWKEFPPCNLYVFLPISSSLTESLILPLLGSSAKVKLTFDFRFKSWLQFEREFLVDFDENREPETFYFFISSLLKR